MAGNFEYTGTELLEILEEAKNYNRYLAKLVVSNAPPKNDKVILLDIGAGIGTFAEMLRNDGFFVKCVEIDEKQREIVEQKGFLTADNIDKIEDNSIDFIYSLNVLEHIGNDKSELEIWLKKLKSGGKIFIYVPAFMILFSSLDREVCHSRRYRKEPLVKMFGDLGLKVKNCKYADSLGFLAALVYKMINKNGKLTSNSVKFYDKIVFPISKILDLAFNGIFGKNVWIVGEKI